MKNKKTAVSRSLLALLLCIAMLIGTTFAWFTDSVTSSQNVITAGKLDLEMYWTDDTASGQWYNVEDPAHNTIFDCEKWEPGYTDVRYIKIVNKGNLALNYKLSLTPQNEVGELAEVINVYFAEKEVKVKEREDLESLGAIGLLSNVVNGGSTANGTILPAGQVGAFDHASGETIVTIAMSMITTAGNKYQGKDTGDFTITAVATQASFEKDSFGAGYDTNALYPDVKVGGKIVSTVKNEGGKLANSVTMKGDGITAHLPAGVALDKGTDKLTLSVTPLDDTSTDLTVINNEKIIPYDIHIGGVSKNNTVPIVIDLGEAMPKYLNLGNYRIYHVENGQNSLMTLVDSEEDLKAHNQFTYDTLTGEVSVAMATFSEVALVADFGKGWEGGEDYTWYDGKSSPYTIANADQLYAFSKIVGGMADGIDRDSFAGQTVKLLSDINLNGGVITKQENDGTVKEIFCPIGYSYKNGDSTVKSFEGTFDGNGHTISSFYQNTWEITGDYDGTYYKDAMGLFGYVYGGTVKNLTVDNFSSDGEFTPTGVIAAYADGNSTFENIANTNCNPRVYNTGNGGIIGIAGDTSAANDDHITLKNITVDNSNKISALWGSWDVACGGLVGMYRGNVDGSGNATGDTISFENCHVSAIIDVYNDVCANYQYYAYRYSGMIIGSVRHNTKNAEGKTIPNMTGISASGCTVNYGDWNDYYYCEFEKNTMASYSEDYQFSRVPHSELNFTDSNGNGLVDADERASVTGCKHTHTAEENHQAIYLPFHQLFTGYSWGVSSIGLKEYSGIVTDLDISEGDKEESVEKFNVVTTLDEYPSGCVLNVGELFKAKEDLSVDIVNDKVQVFVSPTVEGSTVSGTYKANSEDWTKGTLELSGEGPAKITITDYYFCKETTININVAKNVTIDKFIKVFPNTEKYIYRVGNQNSVTLGSLFDANDGANIGNVNINIEGENASGEYINNADWKKGTIKFEKTGLVTVTISDDNKATPLTLELEVVDATNVTSATSAKSNNVVLLNNVGFSTLEVSGGYTLYGNGFKMTATTDPMYDTMNAGFVVLKNGTLDNVQVICPNPSYAIIYNSQIKDKDNTAVPSDSSNDARGNVRSAVMADGNSKIINSYVHGGRAAIFLRSGNLVVDGSTISGGAAANIHTIAAQSLTLRNATLIQKPFQATVHDTSKTLMGFSGLFECGEDGQSTPLTLEGTLIQYAWVNEAYTQYTPSEATSIIENALSKKDYLHDLDGDGTNESLNLGFTYIPQETNGSTNANVTDNRTNKSTVPYEAVDVGTVFASAKVYSYKNTNETDNTFVDVGEYEATTQGPTVPKLSYTDTNADRVFETKFDASDNRWESTLTVNLDNGNYTFGFDKLLAQKHGDNLTYTIKTAGGTEVDASKSISLTSSGVTDYVLTVTDGEVSHTMYFTLTASKTSIPEPKKTADPNGTHYLVVKSKGGDWTCAINALDGAQIEYYDGNGKKQILNLSELVTTSVKGQLNGTNNYWETSKDGYKLKVTCGYIHDTKQIYGMPVAVNGKLYFTISNTNGYVSTNTSGRTVTLTYEFTDPNGKTLTFSKTTQFNYADYKNGTQYSYSDFVNGTLKEASGGSTCVTPDTLVTLANGEQVRIDSLTGNEELLVWNHETGKLDKAPIAYIVNHNGEVSKREIIHLNFANGETVKMIGEHVFFDATLNKYVSIDSANVDTYVGHDFVSLNANGDMVEKVELVSIEREVKETGVYEVVSYKHLTCFTEGILSTSAYLDPLLNVFDINVDTMAYDLELIQKDIATYGLYTYEDFEGLISEEAFELYNAKYLKIAIGKGYITWEDIMGLIDIYFNVDVKPIN